MGWDPSVLRRYNTTGHFRLINQLRTELKGNPLIRPKEGETVGAANRSRSLTRALQNRSQSSAGARSRRHQPQSASASLAEPLPVIAPLSAAPAVPTVDETQEAANARSFRERLSAIEMR